MQVGIVKLFWLNGMEIQGFSSAKPPIPFLGTGPSVYNCSSCQTQANNAFDLLTHHKTKQL